MSEEKKMLFRFSDNVYCYSSTPQLHIFIMGKMSRTLELLKIRDTTLMSKFSDPVIIHSSSTVHGDYKEVLRNLELESKTLKYALGMGMRPKLDKLPYKIPILRRLILQRDRKLLKKYMDAYTAKKEE